MRKPNVSHLPYESSFVPEILTEEHRTKFACHPGVSCFNGCCKQADVMLAPYDVIRLKQNLGMTSEEFLKDYTVPWEMAQLNDPCYDPAVMGDEVMREDMLKEQQEAAKKVAGSQSNY